MHLKKYLAMILAMLLCLSVFTACKKDGSTGAPAITPPTAISAVKQTDYTSDPALLERVINLFGTFDDLGETAASDFEWSENDGVVTVTKYIGTSGTVRVPTAIAGKPVKGIGDAAFADNTALKSLYLPDSITRLGKGILKGCTAIESLRTPQMAMYNDETYYLGYLFAESVTLGNKTPWRDNSALVPPSLKYLSIGRMTKLPDYALFDCNDLECVRLEDCVAEIGTYAMFQCERLVALRADGLTSVGDYGLAKCRTLTRLDFSDRMTSFGFGMLEGCGELRRLTLPFVGKTATESNYLGYLFGATVPEFSKTFYPPYLVEINLLSGCTSLGANAFWECVSLTRISLPETLASIGLRAFEGCVRLQGVAIPAAVTSIAENAFLDCHSLASLTFAENAALTSIGINAFYRCVSLTDVSLPASLSTLPASCFADCTALGRIDLANVARVGKNAFRNCAALRTVIAGLSVEFDDGNDAATQCLPQK